MIFSFRLFNGKPGWRLGILLALLLLTGLAERSGVSVNLPFLRKNIGGSDETLSRQIDGLFNLLGPSTTGPCILTLLMIFFSSELRWLLIDFPDNCRRSVDVPICNFRGRNDQKLEGDLVFTDRIKDVPWLMATYQEVWNGS